ncbi:hypothetical protein Lal_00015976 [Lupinus albus]|nr:hypothetical protein Lal_00015976 [Lupinus albus]
MKRRNTSIVICHKNVSFKFKGKFWRTNVAFLCWICEHNRQDKIESECIMEKVEVTPILEKMVESHLGGLDMCEVDQ